MSINRGALSQYRNVHLRSSIATASPHKLISLLYQGALETLAQAKGAIERGDVEVRTAAINKGCSIIMGLNDSLDLKAGGEVAENLSALYDYILRGMAELNLKNDAGKAEELIELLIELRSGWDAMPQSTEG